MAQDEVSGNPHRSWRPEEWQWVWKNSISAVDVLSAVLDRTSKTYGPGRTIFPKGVRTCFFSVIFEN